MRSFLLINNIDVSFKVESTSPNAAIRYCCMRNGVSTPISNEYLKFSTAKEMINEKHCTLQHDFGKKLHVDLLKLAHEFWNMNLTEVCKTINNGVDPKDLCFPQEIFATTINLLKSYLEEDHFKDLDRIEGILTHDILSSNPEAASSISAHERSING